MQSMSTFGLCYKHVFSGCSKLGPWSYTFDTIICAMSLRR